MKYVYVILFTLFIPIITSAHPGNTDSSGCHTCRTNCSSWGLYTGQYHCHNNKGTTQPEYPIHSRYGSGGTGYTTPAPDYAYPSTPTIPSCPSMSSYDSISGSCKCFSGYIVGTDFLGKQACVSADSKCATDYGYGAQYSSLDNKCECRYGYIMSGNKCVSESEYCSNLIGLMSRYNSLSEKCECMVGYQFDGSSCVYKSTNPGYYSGYTANSASCPLNSHTSLTDSTKCTCDTGYEVNLTKDSCIIKTCPSNSILIGDTCSCLNGYVMRNNQCITPTEDCQKYHNDLNMFGTLKDISSSNCYCNAGYQWNTNSTNCELIPTTPINSQIKTEDGDNSNTTNDTKIVTFNKTLKFGDKGEDVKELQQFLIDNKYLKPCQLGYFGTLTKNALKKFQKANKLKQTGILDKNTLEVLNK